MSIGAYKWFNFLKSRQFYITEISFLSKKLLFSLKKDDSEYRVHHYFKVFNHHFLFNSLN